MTYVWIFLSDIHITWNILFCREILSIHIALWFVDLILVHFSSLTIVCILRLILVTTILKTLKNACRSSHLLQIVLFLIILGMICKWIINNRNSLLSLYHKPIWRILCYYDFCATHTTELNEWMLIGRAFINDTSLTP